MYPIMHRTPHPYHQQFNHGPNLQWKPNVRPRMYHHKIDVYNNRNLGVNNNAAQHWCETCDRGFPNMKYLEQHKQQHQKCNIDGCQFVAHPKVITKHIQMQHSSGLYSKIAKLTNPEEITKWIEERKKKYPTKLNIEKKNAALQEKLERGEKMGLKDSRWKHHTSDKGFVAKRKFNNKNYKQGNNDITRNGFKRSKNSIDINTSNKPGINKQPQKSIPNCEGIKLRPFAGIQYIKMECDVIESEEKLENNFIIEDDDFQEVKMKNMDDLKEPTICGALSALVCNYESSDEEIENKEINCTISTLKKEEQINKDLPSFTHISENQIDVSIDNDEDSGPEEVRVIKNVETNTNLHQNSDTTHIATTSKDNKTITYVNNKRSFHKPKPKLPLTLLHKLLHREMQHERNIVLQCIRHIVKNNYFDK